MPAVFLDRDGVINRKPPEGDYVKSWAEFEFLPGVFEALRALKQHGFRLVVVTNQRGISLGVLREADLGNIHERMAAELSEQGAALDAIYYCPHNYHSCDCRKPQTGLFSRAQRDFPDICFTDSIVIGDSVTDIEAGERLACGKILVGANRIEINSELSKRNIAVDFTAPSLLDAVRCYLMKHDRRT